MTCYFARIFMSKQLAYIVLVSIGLITAGAGYMITKLTFDYEFEHFFPSNDPELEFYQEYTEKFDTDIDFVIMGLMNEEGIFERGFLKSSSNMIEEIKQIPHVKANHFSI